MSDVELLSEDDLEEIQEANEVPETSNVTEEAQAQEAETTNQNQEVKVKKVRNPQVLLNAERLKGPRGIQIIEDIFKKVKFKGRGHEESDLKTLLKGYEYWCHRLYPKFRFDDCIEKIEHLGSKRVVQTHVKKIRMNMLFDDEVNAEGNEATNDFPNETELEPQNDSLEPQNYHLEPQNDPFNALIPTQISQGISNNTQDHELSEEQLRRIEENRAKALKRRNELLQRNAPSTSSIRNDFTQSSTGEFSQTRLSQLSTDSSEQTGDALLSTQKSLSQNEEIENIDSD